VTETIRADLLFSADIEADGPIPGTYSMLSFGLCVVGTFAPDGTFTRHDPSAATFYRELRPISERFLPSALAVSGLDRERLQREGADPATAMTDASAWVKERAADDRPVLVAWPLGFDWMFLHWYWIEFCPTGDPFAHSSALDIKTLAWSRIGRPLDDVYKENLPAELQPTARHTHHALDDAIEQGELFSNLLDPSRNSVR
jgi:hypothetical protein